MPKRQLKYFFVIRENVCVCEWVCVYPSTAWRQRRQQWRRRRPRRGGTGKTNNFRLFCFLFIYYKQNDGRKTMRLLPKRSLRLVGKSVSAQSIALCFGDLCSWDFLIFFKFAHKMRVVWMEGSRRMTRHAFHLWSLVWYKVWWFKREKQLAICVITAKWWNVLIYSGKWKITERIFCAPWETQIMENISIFNARIVRQRSCDK